MTSTIHIAVVGMGFGAEFAPIYAQHPDVRRVTICDVDAQRAQAVAARYHLNHIAQDLDEVLANPDIDAVHLVSGIPDHARQSIAVLESKRHCACTVPMATNLEDVHKLVSARTAAQRVYMMMETAVYDRTFLYLQSLYQRGDLGRIQMLRGAHYQDMENWPSYWQGLPPMWYATHAVAPGLALLNASAEYVHCLGTGYMRQELQRNYQQAFPMESALVKLREQNVIMEVTRSLFHGAHAYAESFSVYGDQQCFEWQQLEDEDPVLFSVSDIGEHPGPRMSSAQRIQIPDYADRLPQEIAPFTQSGVYDQKNGHASFTHGGGHGGSHPHLCHEFISAIMENRRSAIDADVAAAWSALGICAHESAMRDGSAVTVPDFSFS